MISEEDMESDAKSLAGAVGIPLTAIASSSDLNSGAPVMGVPLTPEASIPQRVEKINSLVQKESNLARAGVTRYKYMLVIAEALDAVRWVDEPDIQGNIKRVQKPDVQRRQWAAEQAAKLYGDMIERKEIEHDLGDKTLDRFRVLSVAELKAKALELAGQLQSNRVIDV